MRDYVGGLNWLVNVLLTNRKVWLRTNDAALTSGWLNFRRWALRKGHKNIVDQGQKPSCLALALEDSKFHKSNIVLQ